MGGLEPLAINALKELSLKVFTPIMAFVTVMFAVIAYIIFKSAATDPHFNFNLAIWIWLSLAFGFTPLSGWIMWFQTVKAFDKVAQSAPGTQPTSA
jgi:hypothetical protein